MNFKSHRHQTTNAKNVVLGGRRIRRFSAKTTTKRTTTTTIKALYEYKGAKIVDPLEQLERLFPEVPEPVLKIGKTVYEVVLEPLYDQLPLPDVAKDFVEQLALDEKVNGWTLYTNGTPFEEFLFVAFVVFYLTAQPGILGYAFDETVARAIQTATAGNKFGKRGSNVSLGGRIGDGSFGTVYR